MTNVRRQVSHLPYLANAHPRNRPMSVIPSHLSRLTRLGPVVVLSLPIALVTLVAAGWLQVSTHDLLVLCGLLIAAVGGCTKIGSA